MYASSKEESGIKISDFGLARFIAADQYAMTACGTPNYVAPEIVKG